MPRPLRSFEPGGSYHLTARGNNGRDIAAILESERHLEAACAYVLLNPIRAGLVPTAEDWRWAGAVGSPA